MPKNSDSFFVCSKLQEELNNHNSLQEKLNIIRRQSFHVYNNINAFRRYFNFYIKNKTNHYDPIHGVVKEWLPTKKEHWPETQLRQLVHPTNANRAMDSQRKFNLKNHPHSNLKIALYNHLDPIGWIIIRDYDVDKYDNTFSCIDTSRIAFFPYLIAREQFQHSGLIINGSKGERIKLGLKQSFENSILGYYLEMANEAKPIANSKTFRELQTIAKHFYMWGSYFEDESLVTLPNKAMLSPYDIIWELCLNDYTKHYNKKDDFQKEWVWSNRTPSVGISSSNSLATSTQKTKDIQSNQTLVEYQNPTVIGTVSQNNTNITTASQITGFWKSNWDKLGDLTIKSSNFILNLFKFWQ